MCLAKSCMLYGPSLSKEVNKFGWNEKAVPFEGRVIYVFIDNEEDNYASQYTSVVSKFILSKSEVRNFD